MECEMILLTVSSAAATAAKAMRQRRVKDFMAMFP